MRVKALAVLALGLAVCGAASAATSPDVVTLSIVTTTDLHGNLVPRDGRGGLAAFGGYVRNLRAARADDGGALLLVDSGDTFQGGVESDLSEGAVVVDAYAALGYSAIAIGNHEFDFGAADGPGARERPDADPRGALKALAAHSPFPFLAANLIDDATAKRVAWPNVLASTLIAAAGVKVGIVGIMTIDALRATLRANVQGLQVAPLAETVAREAAALRARGAQVVIVVAHAGGACAELGAPRDLTSCDANAEIFEVAHRLPRGLVDVIAAGHTHQAVQQEVDGIAIVQAYALGRAFGRVDVAFDRRTRAVAEKTIFPPRDICVPQGLGFDCEGRPTEVTGTHAVADATDGAGASYEGRPLSSDAAIEAAMAPALARVHALQAVPLGVVLDTPIPRAAAPDSPLGNLFADAQRERAGADVAINNNVRGGLRADLPAGPLVFGRLYDVFPFDNRLLTLTITGAELRAVLADAVRRNRRGALALSGVEARVACSATGELDVEVVRANGAPLGADERVTVAALDSLVLGPVFAAVPSAAHAVSAGAPLMRQTVEDWLRARGGHLTASDFVHAERPRWRFAGDDLTACVPP
ncbi:MAG TPA: 5'-nucleotidase C-terminal domain-containing protein [Byssovorax sp.]